MVARMPVWTAAVLMLAAVTPAHACMGKTLLLKDDFSRLNPAWHGDPAVVNRGAMRLTASAGHIARVIYTGHVYDRADICIDVTVPATSDPGQQGSGNLIFDARSADDFYLFLVTPARGTAGVARLLNGKWLFLLPFRSAAGMRQKPGETNRLRLTLDGAHATAYLNDARFGGFRINPEPGGGFVGIEAGGGQQQPATWEFRNLKISNLP